MVKVTRKLLIIGVGSSACTHLLPRILEKNLDIFEQNVFMLIDTSERSLEAAQSEMVKAYQRAHSKRVGKIPDEDRTFPVTKFQKRITEASVLLGGEGGGANPKNGLRLFEENESLVVGKINEIVNQEKIDGIIVIGCSGKGTGTLTCPSLVKIINEKFGSRGLFPIGFLTLPFRFRPGDNRNARMSIDYIIENEIPILLIDYECALTAYMYLEEKKLRKPPTKVVYDCVAGIMADVLSVMIEALNLADKCDPPIDWSDLMKMYSLTGTVGTVACSFSLNEQELRKKWKKDFENTIMLRTKTKPRETSGIAIVRSEAGIPMDVHQEIGEYFRKEWRSPEHIIYELYVGGGYHIISIIYGFDPRAIDPPVTPESKGILHKLMGM